MPRSWLLLSRPLNVCHGLHLPKVWDRQLSRSGPSERHEFECQHGEPGDEERNPEPVGTGWDLVERNGVVDEEEVTAVQQRQDEHGMREPV